MRISVDFLNHVKNGYISFKKGYVADSFIVTDYSEPKFIRFMMVRSHPYYGRDSFSCFDGAVYVCGFTEEAMKSLLSEQDLKTLEPITPNESK